MPELMPVDMSVPNKACQNIASYLANNAQSLLLAMEPSKPVTMTLQSQQQIKYS